jgi:hypothetical protein
MILVVYSSRTQGFDGRNFVVTTVNKLPQTKRLLLLEQSLDFASVDLGLHDVITRQVLAHNLHALLANLKKVGTRETWPYFTHGAFSFPPCLQRLKSRTYFDFASLTLLIF